MGKLSVHEVRHPTDETVTIVVSPTRLPAMKALNVITNNEVF
jgi:hypothetical protein